MTDDALLTEERLKTNEAYTNPVISYITTDDAVLPQRSFSFVGYLFLKRFFDIVLSFLGLILLSPVFLILSVIIKASDGGSVFYSHMRVGLNGKPIKLYKFRSMRRDADKLEEQLTEEQLEQYRNEFKIENDPRVTKIGKFLRNYSLDELPQFLNILKGDLSIVGPRPIVDEETLVYGFAKEKLLSVKPGLTGYWQAYARNNVGYKDGKRQRMELYYVDNCSLLFDIKIAFKTVISVFKADGAN